MWLLAALLLLLAATMTMLLLRKARHQIVVLILVVCILVLHFVVLDARRRTKPELRDKGPSDRKLQLEVPSASSLCCSPKSSESEIKSIRVTLTYLR